MRDAIGRWCVRVLCLAVLGPIGGWLIESVRLGNGRGAPGFLSGSELAGGVLALALVGVLILVAAVLAARIGDRLEAVLNVGFVLGWVAWSSGRMGDLFRVSHEAGTLIGNAIEAVILGGLVVAVLLIADRMRAGKADEGIGLGVANWKSALTTANGLVGVGASAASGVAVVWLMARYDAPGQGLGAAFLGGIAGAIAGGMAFQSQVPIHEKKDPDRLVGMHAALLLGLLIAGVVSPLIGLVEPGAGKLVAGVTGGDLPGWVLVGPAAWAAGGLIGVPIGAGKAHLIAAGIDPESKGAPSGVVDVSVAVPSAQAAGDAGNRVSQ